MFINFKSKNFLMVNKKEKNWFARHPILSIIIGIIIFGQIISLITPNIETQKDNNVEKENNEINNNFIKNESNTEILNKELEINNSIIEIEIEEPEIINVELDKETFSGLTVANWNLQIFGQSKASNDTLLNYYKDTMDEYDIIFVQEIRDASGTAFAKLCNLFEEHNCEISSRAGRSSSKEQYGIIYRDGIKVKEIIDFNPDSLDRWERPPVRVVFEVENYSIAIYNLHAKPDDVKNELFYLESIIENEGNVMVIGDLNADCSYYNPNKNNEFDSWNWIIKDSDDTTVASSRCAYDRILLNDDAFEEFSGYGIYTEGIDNSISDHYLIWVSLGIEDFKPEITEKVIVFEEKIEETNDIVKMSNSGICHDKYSSYYDRTLEYTPYNTIQDCLDAGGRLPAR